MSLETFLLWLVIGAIAGWLAFKVTGAGGTLLDCVITGVIGAFLGGVLFKGAGWRAPWAGLVGEVFIAFVGALVLILILWLARTVKARRTPPDKLQ